MALLDREAVAWPLGHRPVRRILMLLHSLVPLQPISLHVSLCSHVCWKNRIIAELLLPLFLFFIYNYFVVLKDLYCVMCIAFVCLMIIYCMGAWRCPFVSAVVFRKNPGVILLLPCKCVCTHGVGMQINLFVWHFCWIFACAFQL